jgi:hypothetical protein
MTDQQAQIRDRIAQMAEVARNRQKQKQDFRPRRPKPVVKAQDIQIPQKEKSGFIGAFLTTCVLLLAFASIPVMYYKGQERAIVEPPTNVEERESTSAPSLDGRQDRWDNSLVSRLAAIESGYKAQQHNLWLLVLAHNENTHLLQQMDSKHHKVQDRGYITFDEKWRFNKSLETMTLTPEQREQIRNGPK